MVTPIGSPRRAAPAALQEALTTAPADAQIACPAPGSPRAAQRATLLAQIGQSGAARETRPRPLLASFQAAPPRPATSAGRTSEEVDHETYATVAIAFQTRVDRLTATKKIEIKQADKDLMMHAGEALTRKQARKNPEQNTAHLARESELETTHARLLVELNHLGQVHGMAEDRQAIDGYRYIVAKDADNAPIGLLRVHPAPDPQAKAPATAAATDDIPKGILKIESVCALPTPRGTGTALMVSAVNLAHKEYGGRICLQNQADGKFYADLGFGIVADKATADGPGGLVKADADTKFGYGKMMLLDTSNPGKWKLQADRWTHPKAQPRTAAAQGN